MALVDVAAWPGAMGAELMDWSVDWDGAVLCGVGLGVTAVLAEDNGAHPATPNRIIIRRTM